MVHLICCYLHNVEIRLGKQKIFEARLLKWKASCLSIGGRVTLIKAVLESLPTYYLSLFKAPAKVIEGLEAIIRRFLWGGNEEARKIHWVDWKRVASPINGGGIGLGKLLDSNLVLLSKWVWRYRVDKDNLWRKVIDAIHGTKKCWSSLPVNRMIAGVWTTIVRTVSKVNVAGSQFNQLFKGEVGDGKSIRFWIDPWASNQALKEEFPRLFSKDKDKKCSVWDKCLRDGRTYDSNWLHGYGTLTADEEDEKQRLIIKLVGLRLNNARDRWKWLDRVNDEFSVKAVKHFLRSGDDYSDRFVFKWAKGILSKCNILMWRLVLNRLPTLDALISRNCYVGGTECYLCGNTEETVDHLFCSCDIAMEVWFMLGRWCKIPPIFLFSRIDIFNIHKVDGADRRRRETLKRIIFATCWCIWKARNDRHFNNARVDARTIFHETRNISHLWYRNRYGMSSISWDRWLLFDIL